MTEVHVFRDESGDLILLNPHAVASARLRNDRELAGRRPERDTLRWLLGLIGGDTVPVLATRAHVERLFIR